MRIFTTFIILALSLASAHLKAQQTILNNGDEVSQEIKFNLYERIYNPAKGENSQWKTVPIKVIAYPITLGFYDVPNMITSTVTESVIRSPRDNAIAVGRDLKATGMNVKNGAFSLVRGIINPKNGAFVDGLLEVSASGVSLVRATTNAVKTGVSTVAYPLFRAFGGKPSRSSVLRNQRAALVFIDTGTGNKTVNSIVDSYGEQVVRYHLKGEVSYYCAIGDSEGGLEDCLAKMPKRIKEVEFLNLRHGGHMWEIEKVIETLAGKGVKPGIVMTIGCYDGRCRKVPADNSMGQMGTSWAVHYYLSNVLSKRLRGIPMKQAAESAYYEGYVTNTINPISWSGLLVTGYEGSRPDVAEGNN